MKKNYYAAAYEKKPEEPKLDERLSMRDQLAEDGFFRVALAAPACVPGQPVQNAEIQGKAFLEAAAKGADLVVFPALSLSGASLGDLAALPSLQRAALEALMKLAGSTEKQFPLLLTSLPVRAAARLIPALALIRSGQVLAFWELEFPQGGPELRAYSQSSVRTESEIQLPDGSKAPLIRRPVALAEMPEMTLYPLRRREDATTSRALLEIAFSFEPDLPGRSRAIEKQIQGESAGRSSAIAYLSPASGESGSYGIYSGHRALAEGGELIARGAPFDTDILLQDIDSHYLQKLSAGHQAKSQEPFLIPAAEIEESEKHGVQVGNFRFSEQQAMLAPPLRSFIREYRKIAFLPPEDEREEYLEDCLRFASRALAKRMEHIRSEHPVLGLSGGLDSCLAQLICLRALEISGQSPRELICVGMPGPGSSARTKKNAEILARAADCDYREIPIYDAVARHLEDIGHDGETEDITYENAQARERTQILMDLANLEKGFVVGTGDLSELALGWCTYNGDQMSMYSVNTSFPKTLVRALCLHEAERLREINPDFAETILDVLATPVSPELTPGEDGEIKQETEAIVGPYELHDFFLYHLLARAASPGKILRLAVKSFQDSYQPEFIRKTLRTFLRRFIQNQFKRSASPEGAVAGPISLAPYGFVMPGDLSADVLLDGLDEEKHYYA